MLSLILPTYNEAQNLPELIATIKRSLVIAHEIIVVDDNSPDRTWAVAEELKTHHSGLKVLRRIGRRGLSSAVVEGFGMAQGDVLMVMDSDLQHDPQLITQMYDAIMGGADIAIASRYIEGGSVGEWVTGRRLLSKAGTYLAHALPPVHSTDPMSGFFALRRSAYEKVARKLHPTGFKILLEILSFLPASSRLAEIPLQFSARKHGESKLNLRVQGQFLIQILRIFCRRFWDVVRSVQWPLFLILSVVVALILLPKVYELRLLYLDRGVRQEVQTTLQRVADNQGWLLSEMEAQVVTRDHVQVLHVAHRRGVDDQECFVLPFNGSPITPCN